MLPVYIDESLLPVTTKIASIFDNNKMENLNYASEIRSCNAHARRCILFFFHYSRSLIGWFRTTLTNHALNSTSLLQDLKMII